MSNVIGITETLMPASPPKVPSRAWASHTVNLDAEKIGSQTLETVVETYGEEEKQTLYDLPGPDEDQVTFTLSDGTTKSEKLSGLTQDGYNALTSMKEQLYGTTATISITNAVKSTKTPVDNEMLLRFRREFNQVLKENLITLP